MKGLKRSHIFLLAIIVSLAWMYFSYLPIVGCVGQILVLFSTLTHELGHGLTAFVLGGDFQTLEIQWDGSGVTGWSGDLGRVARALVAAGGLVGPAMAASLLFWSARSSEKNLQRSTMLFSLALIVIGMLTARSLWAIILTIGLGVLVALAATRLSRMPLESLVVFIGVQLGLSVFTRADYLFVKWAAPNLPSDVSQMADALFLPFWFWGAVCGLFSVLVLLWGSKCYVKS